MSFGILLLTEGENIILNINIGLFSSINALNSSENESECCLLISDYFHLPLILAFTVIFVFLVSLLPCLWVSFIWDSIIDPHHEYETIEV